MRVTDEELDVLGMKYEFNFEGVRDKFSTFNEYVLNYINEKKEIKIVW